MQVIRKSWFIITLFVLLMGGQTFAACHAVGPSASGKGSGSDWNNVMGGLPSTLVRGDTYYLADGSYGSYSFTTANSGTTRIVVKKAQSYDFGRTSDGCSNDISAGWNASTMGASQAVFSNFGNSVATPGFFTLDGNGASTSPGCGTSPATNASASDCGIKLIASGSGPLDIGVNAGGANRSNGWTLRYTEIAGPGDASLNMNFIWCHGGCDSLFVEHAWWYNSACVFFKIPWTAGVTVQTSYFKQNFSASFCHGQFYLSEVNTSNVDFHNNILQDIQGTGVWVIVTGGSASNYNIYNNVLFRTQGSSRPGTSNGIFACINSGSKCTNWNFIGNTIVNYTADYSGALGIQDQNGGGSYTWQNNLFYNISPADRIGFTLSGSAFTEDHNSWLNAGSPINGTADVTVTSGAPNPFVNWPSSNFQLSGENADWTAGVTLQSPFNLDMAGNQRPGTDAVWDRGALEFSSTQAQRPAPPTNLAVSVH